MEERLSIKDRLSIFNVYLTYGGGFVLHIWTVYISATLGGLLETILTVFFPVAAELYWFIVICRDRGFFNPYIIACLVFVFSYILTSFIISRWEKRMKETEEGLKNLLEEIKQTIAEEEEEERRSQRSATQEHSIDN